MVTGHHLPPYAQFYSCIFYKHVLIVSDSATAVMARYRAGGDQYVTWHWLWLSAIADIGFWANGSCDNFSPLLDVLDMTGTQVLPETKTLPAMISQLTL